MALAQDTLFHDDQGRHNGIPAPDALIAIYAAYYMGSNDHAVKDNMNAHFNLRAANAFNMTRAMEQAFGQQDSPWVVLDHLSDTRRDAQNPGDALRGAHFIALYHKQSGRVMIAMPGLESDDNPGDTLMDLAEMTVGGMRGQSSALYKYTKEIEQKLSAGAFTGADGRPIQANADIIIGAHSMGCTAAQMMALDGYKTVLIEPRPLHDGLLNRVASNYAHITGTAKLSKQDTLAKLDASAVNIRSRFSNVWNSIILPWVKQHENGQNFSYAPDGHKAKPADRGIGTFHRVEMSVPSINGIAEARGYEAEVTLTPAPGQHRNLISDILKLKPKTGPKA